jgi:nucleoside-diphosphate-sugar epimerase
MRVALTGADGFTGAYVQAALEAKGVECLPLRADLTDPAAVDAEVDQRQFDKLIHLAGEAFVASSDWRRFYAVNHIGTLTLLDVLAARRPGTRCILASSAQVYGPDAAGLVTEDHPTRPNNHYALSKLAMEICAQAFADRLEIVVTRPFNYTGVGQQDRYIIPKIVEHFRRHATTIELGNIEVQRDFGDVRSVAEAYAGLVLSEAPPPVVNISTGRAYSIRDILLLAQKITNCHPSVEINAAFVRANDVPLLVGDHRRLSEALPDWRPRPIEETLTWMLSAA